MIVLGIETSCDETSVAILDEKKILSSPVISQDEIHAKYGGVVPELASRRHMETISMLLRKALQESNVSKNDIDVIAVTFAPGLLGSILVGLQFAKGLALAWNKPLVGVNHLEGHLNAAEIEHDIPFPYLGLVVSGGHTSLYLVKEFGNYKRIANTIDDAAGEAFDKVAKLLSLGYPGGPRISKIAEKGNAKSFPLTTPFIKNNELAFSFSGIKTQIMHIVKQQKIIDEKFKENIAASFQEKAIKFLLKSTLKAAKDYNVKAITVGGGVSANKRLREKFKEEASKINLPVFIPHFNLCTDNAAMIAYVGLKKFKQGITSSLSLNAVANMEIG